MRILILLVVGSLFSSFVYAQTIQENRRIEEIKRKSLNDDLTNITVEMVQEIDFELKRKDRLRTIFERRYITFADAAVICLALLRQDQNFHDTDSRLEHLFHQNIVPRNLKILDYQKIITQGDFAYMVLQTLGIKGGLSLRVLGPTKRYAFKELRYLGVMPEGYIAESLSGNLAGYVFSTAQDYLEDYHDKK